MIVLLKSSGFKPMVKCCDRLVFWLGLDVISRAHQSWGGGGGWTVLAPFTAKFIYCEFVFAVTEQAVY